MKFKVTVRQEFKYSNTLMFLFDSWEEAHLFCSAVLHNEVPTSVEIEKVEEVEECSEE